MLILRMLVVNISLVVSNSHRCFSKNSAISGNYSLPPRSLYEYFCLSCWSLQMWSQVENMEQYHQEPWGAVLRFEETNFHKWKEWLCVGKKLPTHFQLTLLSINMKNVSCHWLSSHKKQKNSAFLCGIWPLFYLTWKYKGSDACQQMGL